MSAKIRVALVTTHPIQYQIPWFQGLAARSALELKVFFGMLPDDRQQGQGFGVGFQWDIPLLEGYDWELVTNVAQEPSLGRFSGIDTPGIGQALRAWRPAAVIITGWNSRMLVQAWWACVRLGLPRIVRGDSNDLVHRAWWKRLVHRLWLRGFDRFLAVGESNRRFYLGAGISPSRLYDCPHFIDNLRFMKATASLGGQHAKLRRDWGVAQGVTCFLFAGKLTPIKRPLDLIRALELTVGRGARTHLLVAGSGELMAEARALVDAERLPVTFTGFLNQTELVKAYVAADCLVLPSNSETWGLVVNEAMACGLPAIVSDRVGCAGDLVVPGVTGAVFPRGDIQALAGYLADFAAHPERLRDMGARACQRVTRGYSVEQAVAGTLAALDSLGLAA